MQYNTAILFAGLIDAHHLDIVIASAIHIEAIKFASIWHNTDEKDIQKLIDNDFIIIKNNTNDQDLFRPQNITIVNALKFIKDNYKHIEYVLKTRFDIITSDYNTYLEKTRHLYNKLTVISGIETDITYFLDIIVSGNIDVMTNFFRNHPIHDKRAYEQFLLENYLNTTPTKSDITSIMNFTLDICIKNNIEFLWIRGEGWKYAMTTFPYMEVISKYCKNTFIFNN